MLDSPSLIGLRNLLENLAGGRSRIVRLQDGTSDDQIGGAFGDGRGGGGHAFLITHSAARRPNARGDQRNLRAKVSAKANNFEGGLVLTFLS